MTVTEARGHVQQICNDLKSIVKTASELHASVHEETGRAQTQQAIAGQIGSIVEGLKDVEAFARETLDSMTPEHGSAPAAARKTKAARKKR